ncbi:hypothetical protein Tco_0611106 [Tanacetum coccineum]
MEKKDTLSSCSDSEIQQMQLIQDKTKESCMVSFQRLHSHLKCLLNNDLKGSRTEDGFKRAFTTLFCQDLETFTGTMFLNVDQLEKQLDNKEFQEIGSMASFKVLETQFQMFINSQIYLNDEYIVMTRNYFLEYTRLDIPEFRDTLIQNMDYVKKSIEKRALHKMEYDSRVNERLTQTTEEKVDLSKALDASLVIIESNGTESQEQDTSSRSGNDAHVDDADIRPIYNEEPMDFATGNDAQTSAEINIFATGQQHPEQPEFNNEGEVATRRVESQDVCLCWVPTGKIFTSSTTKVDSEPQMIQRKLALTDVGKRYKLFDGKRKISQKSGLLRNFNLDDHQMAALPQGQIGVLTYDNSEPWPPRLNVVPLGSKSQIVTSRVGIPLLASLEAVRIFGAHAALQVFSNLSEMDVGKTAFLNGFHWKYIEVLRCSAEGFVYPEHPNNSLHSLGKELYLLDDIILGSTNPNIQKRFEKLNAQLVDGNVLNGGRCEVPWCKLVSWMLLRIKTATAMYSAVKAETEYQLADMFTKALPEDRFKYLVRRIGMRCLTPADLDHKVVRLGINPMIQPEPKDLPKDNPKLEIAVLRMSMLVKVIRSQDGIDDKDNDKGSKSRSQSMKEQAYNKEQRERPRPHELNDKSNLIDLMKECHQ